MRRVSTVAANRKGDSIERLRREAEAAQQALDDAEEAQAEAERIARRAAHARLTARQLDELDEMSSDGVIGAAVDELRNVTISVHERNVLEGVRARCTGDERDVLERLLAMTAPREEALL